MVAIDMSARAVGGTKDHRSNESNGLECIAVSIASTAVAAVSLSLRLWTRLSIVRNFGPEDWIILAAFVLSVGNTIAVGFEVLYGQGHHVDTLEADSIVKILKVRRHRHRQEMLLTPVSSLSMAVSRYILSGCSL